MFVFFGAYFWYSYYLTGLASVLRVINRLREFLISLIISLIYHSKCSLGLSRLGVLAKLQTCLTTKLPNKGKPVDFPPVYGTLNKRKSAIEATTRPRRGYRHLPFTVTVYLFLAKLWCLYSKLANKRIPVDFPPFYCILNENQLLRAQQNQEGNIDIPSTVTVYLFLAKSVCRFNLT